jgi:hypothetical protein
VVETGSGAADDDAGSPKAPLYLIDTSVWIPVLRRRGRGPLTPLQERVDELISADAVAVTGIVRTELLIGTSDGAAYERLRGLLLGLRYLDTEEGDWDAAGRLGQQLRLAGVSAQTTDLVIAAVAIRAGAIVLHRDGDFERIAQHAALKTESHL